VASKQLFHIAFRPNSLLHCGLLDSRRCPRRATPLKKPPDLVPAEALQPAPLLRRLAALCYDALLLVALLATFTLLVILSRGGRAVAPGTWWFEGLLCGIAVLFFCWFWVHGGQTLGMRAWRIRVVGLDGSGIGWGRALLRFAAALAAAAPLGAGFLWSLFDARRRCWHDRLSRTLTVREPPRP
jgi:uncharacterized RDD family membrane protein YckC